MQKLLHFFIIVVTGILLTVSCNRPACHSAAEPYALVAFQLYKNGQLVTDSSILASIKVYFVQNNQKWYTDIHGITNAHETNIDTLLYKNRIMTLNLFSGESYSRNYFLEYTANPQWPIDTLYVDYIAPSPATDCGYRINTLKFNSVAPIDTTIAGISRVYKFGK